MREVRTIVDFWDDVDLKSDGKKNEAALTVTLGFNGVWRELDLSEAHHEQLQRELKGWLDAGHPPKGPVTGPKSHQTRKSPEFEYRAELRAFATAHDFSYITKTGKYYYSKKLVQAYEASLAEQGG